MVGWSIAKWARQGKDKVRTWQKMKKLLKEKFLTLYYMQDNFSKFHHLEQENNNVEGSLNPTSWSAVSMKMNPKHLFSSYEVLTAASPE